MTQKCPICNNEIADDATECPHCGFKLFGSTQSFKPITLDSEEMQQETQPRRSAHLKIVRGPQTGLDIDLQPGKLTVGRNPQCDIFLNDMTVSRHHAIIETTDRGVVIYDSNSYNGVWVNNNMEDACLLKSGDIVQIGAFCLQFVEG